MRDITIDLRGAEVICSSYSIGRDGENNATEFVVKFPDKLVGYNVIFEFFHESGWKYSSEVFPYAREIIFSLPDRVVSAGELTLSIVCVKGSNVYKPFERTFVVQESIGVNENEGVELEWIDDHERRITALEESEEITDDDTLSLMKETELIDGVLSTIVDDEEYLLVTDDGEEKAIFI